LQSCDSPHWGIASTPADLILTEIGAFQADEERFNGEALIILRVFAAREKLAQTRHTIGDATIRLEDIPVDWS
jgi:hypothetical protein